MDPRVIIPVKPFREAKQRLAPVLQAAQRAMLAERMFRHVLGVSISFFGTANVLVVSRSEDVLTIVRSEGGQALLEGESAGLNSAVSQGVRAAAASKVLILASDLPLLGPNDLAEMTLKECAIAPDRHQRGTNALLWPAHLPFAFGADSFARHCAIAEAASFAPTILACRGLTHDVDVPDDLNSLRL